MTKIRSITKLYSVYLLYEYSKRFVEPLVRPVVQQVVPPAAQCKLTFSGQRYWNFRNSFDVNRNGVPTGYHVALIARRSVQSVYSVCLTQYQNVKDGLTDSTVTPVSLLPLCTAVLCRGAGKNPTFLEKAFRF